VSIGSKPASTTVPPAAASATPPAPERRRRRWLRWTLLGMAALLLGVVVLAIWLAGTGSGLRFALNRAVVMLDDRFSYESAEGSLLGGMRLTNVHYGDEAIGDYRVASIEIAPRSRRLLGGELHLTGVTLRDVRVVLPPPSGEPTPPSDEPFQLPVVVAPIGMRIDALAVEGVDVRQHDGTQVIVLDRIDGAATWAGTRIDVQRLDVDAPDGELRLVADIDTGADWAGDAGLDFRWQLPDMPQPFAGRLDLHGPQSDATANIALTQPSPAQLDLRWLAGDGTPEWQLAARSEAFALAGVMVEPPFETVALDLQGTGTLQSADVGGRVALDGYGIVIERLAGQWPQQRVLIEALALAEESGPGRVEGTADIDLSGRTPTGRVDAHWQSISPPLAAPFDALDANGRIEASGSLDALVADVQADANVDGTPLRLALHAQGDPREEIRFAPLKLATGDGTLEAEGSLRVEPHLQWQAQLRARGFDPGLLAPEWPGRIALDASTTGRVENEVLHAHVDLARLSGTLRQQPLAGSGTVDMTGTERIDADVDVRLGDSRLDLAGRLGSEYDLRVEFDIASLGTFLDDAAGRVHGDARVRGAMPALDIDARVTGEELAAMGHRAATLEATIDLRTDFARAGLVDIAATDLVLAGQPVERLTLEGRGDAGANTLALDVSAERGDVVLAMAGRYDRAAAAWTGMLETLTIASEQLPAPLALDDPAALVLSAARVSVERACLRAEATSLCTDADWQAGTGGDFGFELARLPLAWLVSLAGDELLVADGELGGQGRFRIDAGGALAGEAQIEGTPGAISLAEAGTADRDLVAWTQLATTVSLQGEDRRLQSIVELSPAGRIDVEFATRAAEGDAATLDGDVELFLPDLSLIELLTPDVVNPAGELRGRLAIAGTTGAPSIRGNVDLAQFGAELPALGLRLRDSHVALDADSGNRINVEGRLVTAENSALELGGWFGLPANGRVPMDVRVTGERVLVADMPAARVFASPDLRISADDEGLAVNGEVTIPQARIHPEDFEGGAVAASPDVYVVDPQVQAELVEAEEPGLPLRAVVTVRLGDRVDIEGYGLKGRLRGSLEVREEPGRPTSGRGEIVVTGTYQAYGQDLDIERGRLMFAGSPLANPLLDIRATRKVEAVTAGLAVTGNVQRPVLEVYSVPAMDQAEALSYLVLGRPLRQATSAEDQDLLGTAATAVSTAGGDLLAKSLGARLGLDEVGVGTSRELGAGALTVGKYLSPRLYVGYGRSLFDGSQLVSLRYRLSERFELEAQSGTRENKAGLNYRYER
jgi:translocation and assembly module TamB